MRRQNWALRPAKPEGAEWAAPLGIITDVTYRADGAGYLKPGYTHAFVVSAEGGAPRQLTFGAFNEAGPLSWSADGRFLFMSGNRTENWRLEPLHTEVYQVALADGALTALTNRPARRMRRSCRRTARISPTSASMITC
jgi:hypothetical protein